MFILKLCIFSNNDFHIFLIHLNTVFSNPSDFFVPHTDDPVVIQIFVFQIETPFSFLIAKQLFFNNFDVTKSKFELTVFELGI